MARATAIEHDARPDDLVDLARYPITNPCSPGYRSLIEGGRTQLATRRACILPGFIARSAIPVLAREAEGVARVAYHVPRELCTYSESPDPSWPADHPRRHRVANRYGFAGLDLLPPNSALARLYGWRPLIDLVAALLGLSGLHRYGDPIAALTVSIMDAGDHQGWHFDLNDFIVSLLLRKPMTGGCFEFVPLIRSETAENYDDVARVLAGGREGVIRVPPEEGTFVLFMGRHSLHRVTPVEAGRRLIALLAYDSLPGQLEPDDNLLVVYGRTRDPAERDRLRAQAWGSA
jgi:hypothetical protein